MQRVAAAFFCTASLPDSGPLQLALGGVSVVLSMLACVLDKQCGGSLFAFMPWSCADAQQPCAGRRGLCCALLAVSGGWGGKGGRAADSLCVSGISIWLHSGLTSWLTNC
jgi:hypothetical protein